MRRLLFALRACSSGVFGAAGAALDKPFVIRVRGGVTAILQRTHRCIDLGDNRACFVYRVNWRFHGFTILVDGI